MRHHFTLNVATSALALLFALPAQAAPILTGAVTAPVAGATGYTGTLTVSQATGELGAWVGDSFQILCIDNTTAFPYNGSVHSYSWSNTLTASMMAYGANAARATDLVNWMIDKSYDSLMRSGGSGTSVNRAMWEITTDFNGVASSLNTRTGNFQLDTASFPTTVSLVDALRNSYASIAEGYRSTKYTVSFLDDLDGRYQNMVMLSPAGVPPAALAIPEPESIALAALGLAAAWVARRRIAR